MAEDALLYISQKAFIEKDGKLLVLHDPVEELDFPGGKIQEGEGKVGDMSCMTNSLKREVLEEVGLDIEVMEPFAVWYHEFTADHRNAGKSVYIVAFTCKYLSGEVTLSDEHDRFKWVDKSNYTEVNDGSDFFEVLQRYYGDA